MCGIVTMLACWDRNASLCAHADPMLLMRGMHGGGPHVVTMLVVCACMAGRLNGLHQAGQPLAWGSGATSGLPHSKTYHGRCSSLRGRGQRPQTKRQIIRRPFLLGPPPSKRPVKACTTHLPVFFALSC